MASGDKRVAWENVDIEDARLEMFIDRIESAGWQSGGGFNPDGETHVGFYRRDGLYMLSPEETAIRLKLLDEEGHIVSGRDEFDSRTGQVERFGYDVETDPKSGEVVIGYSGPDDERYQAFFEDLLALGHDLNNQQEVEAPDFVTGIAQAREAMAHGDEGVAQFLRGGVKPVEATNKLIRQVSTAEGENGTIQMMVEAGIPRQEAIAGVVNTVATTFCEDLPGAGYKSEVDFLERWHAHVDYRYTKLLEALEAQSTGDLEATLATNPVLETLGGIRDGVRQSALRSRERAEQQEAEQDTE